MPIVDVVRTYLEMRSPDALRPASAPHPDVRVERQAPCAPATYRDLYERVGRQWHWRDRLAWSEETLARHLARPDIAIWILRESDRVAGFFELASPEPGVVEICYFGLLPEAIGRGLGKYMLTRAVEEAWAAGASRVCLNTCTLDGPAALPNYRARGFVPYRTEMLRANV